MRLSKTQAEVAYSMRKGWELVGSLEANGGCSLLKGTESKRLSRATLMALLRRGVVIEASREFPLVRYKLVEG